jgi:DNA (cytosine-5)-methyltransferase 1
MGIEHQIVFACDNGNIDLKLDCLKEFNKVKELGSFEEKNQYVKKLYSKSRKTNFIEKSYLANYKVEDNNFFYDVRLLDGSDFKDKLELLVGGSPCQSFSIAGARGGFEDTRGTLFYDYVRIIKESKPKVFIYENVFGLTHHDKGKTWEVMQNVFSELGYYIKWDVLDARNYGIPQGRRRLFVLGFQSKEQCDSFTFPKQQPLSYTMQDFLIDNCSEGNFTNLEGKINISAVPGVVDERYYLSEKLINYVMSPGTKNFMHVNDSKIDLPIARAILSTQGNTHRSSVNNYVTTNGRIRALTTRESLRLMGFTDDFKIVVSKAQSYKQSGNSIVVDVLIAILKELLLVMEV